MTLQESIALGLLEREWKVTTEYAKLYFPNLRSDVKQIYLDFATKVIERSDIKLASN